MICWRADPQFWAQFVVLAERDGHKVVAVSGRSDTEEHRQALRAEYPPSVQIILCNHRPKKAVMAERGIRIHIWISDYGTPPGRVRGQVVTKTASRLSLRMKALALQ